MGKLRFLLALWLAKLSVPALKITRHNGTDFPGSLALKLCPDFLRYVGKPGAIIAVTGTNGKTTVSNLLTDILEADGKKVLSNRSGSNITSGISTALLRGCDLLGRAKSYDMAVLEVDERASVRIFPYVKPDYVVVTNLTRDSIMRNAHPGYIADILTRSIPPDGDHDPECRRSDHLRSGPGEPAGLLRSGPAAGRYYPVREPHRRSADLPQVQR